MKQSYCHYSILTPKITNDFIIPSFIYGPLKNAPQYIISRAGHASHASRAGRVSCSCSAGYVTRAGYVVCTLTDNC